jgi:hypothetical protein
MCVNDLKDIHYLFEYQPHEGRYGKFGACKIISVNSFL